MASGICPYQGRGAGIDTDRKPFPGPFENDDTAPPTGADRLVIEFDPPTSARIPAIEFLDWTGEPVELDDPEIGDPPRTDPCAVVVPEFCEDPNGDFSNPPVDPCRWNPFVPACQPSDPPRRH